MFEMTAPCPGLGPKQLPAQRACRPWPGFEPATVRVITDAIVQSATTSPMVIIKLLLIMVIFVVKTKLGNPFFLVIGSLLLWSTILIYLFLLDDCYDILIIYKKNKSSI